jgi:hypothetical protein
MKKKTKGIRMTLLQAAEEFGVARETLRRALRQSGIKPGADGKQTVREYHAALSGDGRTGRFRLAEAKAKLAELELKEREFDLLPREDVATFILGTFAPLREFVVAMPGQLAAQVNPNDATHARAILDRWRDEFLKLKEKIPMKEKSKK